MICSNIIYTIHTPRIAYCSIGVSAYSQTRNGYNSAHMLICRDAIYTQTLGQVGMVTKLTFFSHVQVSVNGKRWVFDPHCLITASADQLPDNFGIYLGIKLIMRLMLYCN